MKKILFIIDAQNDFCSRGGSLVCEHAETAVDNIRRLLETEKFDRIICTLDTHGADYIITKEGQDLPVEHCQKNTWGFLPNRKIYDALYEPSYEVINKNSFMVKPDDLHNYFDTETEKYEIFICGFATDICVLNNALLIKNTLGQLYDVSVIENCCAGTTAEMHVKAIEIMKGNFIKIV